MKKTLKILSMMFCVMLMAVCLNSCSSDDDDEKVVSIVGTWENVSDGYTTQMTFNSNGSCTWKGWSISNPSENETDKGTYKVEGNRLSVWWDSESDEDAWTCTFVIEGNKMSTSENGGTVWTRI